MSVKLICQWLGVSLKNDYIDKLGRKQFHMVLSNNIVYGLIKKFKTCIFFQ